MPNFGPYPYNTYGNPYQIPRVDSFQTPTYATDQTSFLSRQPYQGLIKVTGIDGAKAYQLPPNSVIPLFDANEDIMYIKSTDGAGFPTIREFTFSPTETHQQAVDNDYVPRSEFDNLVAKVEKVLNYYEERWQIKPAEVPTNDKQSVPTISPVPTTVPTTV